MKTWLAILFSISLIFFTAILETIFNFPAVILTILLTAVWAAWDSKKIELAKYKSGISYGPVPLFILILLLWILAFPWYLSARYKIKNGLAQIKANISEKKNI